MTKNIPIGQKKAQKELKEAIQRDELNTAIFVSRHEALAAALEGDEEKLTAAIKKNALRYR
jgi:hypothetical protein